MVKYIAFLLAFTAFAANAGALNEAKQIQKSSIQATRQDSATAARIVAGCGYDYPCDANGNKIDAYANNPNVVDLGKGDSHTVEIIKKDVPYKLGPNKVPPKPGEDKPILEPKTLQDGENTKVILDEKKTEEVKIKVEQAKEKATEAKQKVQETKTGTGRPVVGHTQEIKQKPTKQKPSMKQAFSNDPFAEDASMDKKYKSAAAKDTKTYGSGNEEALMQVAAENKRANRIERERIAAEQARQQAQAESDDMLDSIGNAFIGAAIGTAVNRTTYKPAKVTTTEASRPADVYRRGIADEQYGSSNRTKASSILEGAKGMTGGGSKGWQ